jgi:hypothetical protein
VKSKVKSIFIIFFDIKGIAHEEYVLAGQTVKSTYCCDVLQWLCEDMQTLHSELWRQNIWLLNHDNTLSRQGIFYQKQHDWLLPTILS